MGWGAAFETNRNAPLSRRQGRNTGSELLCGERASRYQFGPEDKVEVCCSAPTPSRVWTVKTESLGYTVVFYKRPKAKYHTSKRARLTSGQSQVISIVLSHFQSISRVLFCCSSSNLVRECFPNSYKGAGITVGMRERGAMAASRVGGQGFFSGLS